MQGYLKQLRDITTDLKDLMRPYHDKWTKNRPTCWYILLKFRHTKYINMIWNEGVKKTTYKETRITFLSDFAIAAQELEGNGATWSSEGKLFSNYNSIFAKSSCVKAEWRHFIYVRTQKAYLPYNLLRVVIKPGSKQQQKVDMGSRKQ